MQLRTGTFVVIVIGALIAATAARVYAQQAVHRPAADARRTTLKEANVSELDRETP